MTLKEKREWQEFLIRYVMEFGTQPVSVGTLIGNSWYQSGLGSWTINPSIVPEGISYWVDGIRGNPIELGPLAFKLIAEDLTSPPPGRKIIDNPKKGAL